MHKELTSKIYSPESALRNPVQMMRDMLGDIFASRELAWELAERDLRAQYRQAALGMLWALILPIANTATWIFFQRTGVVSVGPTQLSYPLYVITGVLLWSIFVDAVNAPLTQTLAAKSMLAKLNFPREALVVSGIYQTAFNAVLKTAVLLFAILVLRGNPTWTIVVFPFVIVSIILIGTVLGLLITPMGMLYADVGKALPVVLQVSMYVTPVVFPMPNAGRVRDIFLLNPITPAISTGREVLTGTTLSQVKLLLVMDLGAIAILFVVWVCYRAAMPILIERMSA